MKNYKRMISALAAAALAGTLAMNVSAYSATDIYTQQAAMQQDEFNATYIPIRPAETDSNYVNYFDWTQAAGLAIHCEDTAFLAEEYGIDCTPFSEQLAYYQNFGADDESYVLTDITLPEAYQGKQDDIYFISTPEEEVLTALIADARMEIIGIAQVTQRVKAWPSAEATTLVIYAAEGATVDAALLSAQGAGTATYDAEHNYWEFETYLPEEELFAFCAQLEEMDEIAFAWPYGIFNPSAEYYTVTACDIMEIADYTTFGDINGDDKVDSTDAILVLREYNATLMDSSVLSETEQAAADINGDGNIDSNDATLILQYYTKGLSGQVPEWQEILNPTTPAE